MVPSNRDQFKEWCLRKLGEPVIMVNVAPEQVEDRIDEGLYHYYQTHYNGVDEATILYTLTSDDVTQGYVKLPDDTAGVIDVLTPSMDGSLTSTGGYTFNLVDMQAMSNLYQIGNLTYYYMTQAHLTLLNRFFTPDRTYGFNANSKRLFIRGMASVSVGGQPLAIRIYRKVKIEHTDPSDTSELVNIWGDNWLQNYCTALIKQQWAMNLSKFQNVSLIGGVTMNGEQLYQMANDELEKLKEDLEMKYQMPPSFFVG